MEHVNTGTIRVVKEINKADLVEKVHSYLRRHRRRPLLRYLFVKGSTTIKATSAERKIFSHLKGCPYVCKVFAATQDPARLYMLLEFCPGALRFRFSMIFGVRLALIVALFRWRA